MIMFRRSEQANTAKLFKRFARLGKEEIQYLFDSNRQFEVISIKNIAPPI